MQLLQTCMQGSCRMWQFCGKKINVFCVSLIFVQHIICVSSADTKDDNHEENDQENVSIFTFHSSFNPLKRLQEFPYYVAL